MAKKPRFKIDRALRREVKAMPCFICKTRFMVDPCHIKTFGSSGIEEWWNMVPMCRAHHNEQHSIGWWRFCQKYPKMAALIQELGWEFLEPNPGNYKLFNPKEREDAAGV